MKKLIAVLFAAALLMLAVVPAMANSSIGPIGVVGELEVLRDENNPVSDYIAGLLDEGWYPIIRDVQPESYSNAAVKEIVTEVNSDETKATIDTLISGLKDYQADAAALDGLQGADYVTKFSELVLTNGTEYVFTEAGEKLSVRAELTTDAMKGVDAADLGSYAALMINPNSGEVSTSSINVEGFDSEAGTLTVDFQSLGAFTLIQE